MDVREARNDRWSGGNGPRTRRSSLSQMHLQPFNDLRPLTHVKNVVQSANLPYASHWCSVADLALFLSVTPNKQELENQGQQPPRPILCLPVLSEATELLEKAARFYSGRVELALSCGKSSSTVRETEFWSRVVSCDGVRGNTVSEIALRGTGF